MDQSATPNTVLSTNETTAGSLANLYNTCVTLPATTLSAIGLGLVCNHRSAWPARPCRAATA